MNDELKIIKVIAVVAVIISTIVAGCNLYTNAKNRELAEKCMQQSGDVNGKVRFCSFY